MTVKILAFAGSLRKDSYNKQLVKIALEGAKQEGAVATYIDLKDYPLPLYDADIEAQGMSDVVKALKQLFWEHQGLLIATPEYNSGITAVLKNLIDWVSRPQDSNEPPLSCFKNKVVGLLSASIGPLGGRRSLVQVRDILQNISCLVLPDVYHAAKAADGLGDLEKIQAIGKRLTQTLQKLAI